MAAVLLTVSAAAAAKPARDRTANIADAAKRLAEMHRAQGSRGVIKFLDACYRTHMLASKFTAPLEACMAQDYMHARVLVEIYARLPDEARSKFNAPDPDSIAASVGARFASVIGQYAIDASDAEALKTSIEKNGLPIFLKSVFPAQDKDAGHAGGGK